MQNLQDADRLGGQLAGWLRGGGVLLLEGPLGAGKTTLVQRLCAALGVTDAVTSPTFDLLHIYRGEGCIIFHVDGYRLEWDQDWDILDLPVPLVPGAIVAAEWAQVLRSQYPERLELRIEWDAVADRRLVHITAFGDKWCQVLAGEGGSGDGIQGTWV